MIWLGGWPYLAPKDLVKETIEALGYPVVLAAQYGQIVLGEEQAAEDATAAVPARAEEGTGEATAEVIPGPSPQQVAEGVAEEPAHPPAEPMR